MPRMNIEAERARLGFTKAQMCTELGISFKTYDKFVKGDTIPGRALEKLHSMSGKSFDYLLEVSP